MIRNFTLTNALGQTYSLMNTDDGAMFEPGGLGYDDVTEYEQVGEFFAPLTERFGQQVITGQMVFGANTYVKYLNFTKFCRHAPLSLIYETDAGTFQIPVRMTKIEKGDTDGWTYLQCPVEFTALARMYKTVVANNTGSAGGGKKYLEKSYPDVSGSIVTIMDNTSTQTTFNLSADINPIQDLHGYNAPWVGGGGKNKLSIPEMTDSSKDVTITATSEPKLTFNGTRSGSATFVNIATGQSLPAGTYILNGGESGDAIGFQVYNTTQNTAHRDTSGNGVSFTVNEGDLLNYRVYIGGNATATNMVRYPMIRLSSELDSSWQPYENICPISGRSSVDTVRTGANLVRVARAYSSKNGITYTENADGTVHAKGTASAESLSAGNPVSAIIDADSRCLYTLPIGTYNIRNISGGRIYCQIIKADLSANISTQTLAVGNETNVTLTEPSVIYIRVDLASGTAIDADINVTVVKGTTALTPYVPWNGSTYTTALGTTVYGGTLDVVSGLLTVTHKYISAQATFASSYNTDSTHANAIFGFNVNDSQISVNNNAKYGIVSNLFEEVTFNQALSASNEYYGTYLNNSTGQTIVRVAIPKSLGILTVADFNTLLTSMGGIQIAYPIATPQTYQLTPQQVELLLGTNYVWANSGDVYLSNLKTYGYIYDYVYGDFVADTVTIDSDSVTASPCRISIFGPCTQPTWRHYVDGVQVATGYYNGTIPQNHKLVIDTTSSPYSIQEEDIAGNLIADRYELCDFSTERFFLLEYGKNTISVGHGDVDSIRLMVEGYIFYETV